jgi:tRNA dimethylallyltransferase
VRLAGCPPLIAVVGPTGVGKTRTAISLCQEVGGEIVSADSRQVYKGLDIGTDKPSLDQRSLVPHHLLDVIEPNEDFTLAQYQSMAYQTIDHILGRGRVAFLVGGTGLYVRAVLEGFAIPRVPPDAALRRHLKEEAKREGRLALHARLAEVDPEAAASIDARNVRRVIRALEVYETLGEPISSLQRRQRPCYRILTIGLTMDRELLYRRVDERVDRMMEKGLVDEVRRLLEAGYSPELPAMSGLGYRQICSHLRGETDLADAVRQIKSETHRFVRQQYKWFRLDDEAIHWFDLTGEPITTMLDVINAFLTQSDCAPLT